jgi:3-hydroxybutyryl-CoA dehydratase
MSEFYVKPGDSVSFAKTVGESDVYLFAGITGDFAVNHVNEQYMSRSKYGRRIAHGALLIGFASTCSTLMIDKCRGTAGDETPVSLGYDKVRFLGPVYIGDTVTLTYTITEVDVAKRRSRSTIRVVNDRGELVGVAEHILAWVKDTGAHST